MLDLPLSRSGSLSLSRLSPLRCAPRRAQADSSFVCARSRHPVVPPPHCQVRPRPPDGPSDTTRATPTTQRNTRSYCRQCPTHTPLLTSRVGSTRGRYTGCVRWDLERAFRHHAHACVSTVPSASVPHCHCSTITWWRVPLRRERDPRGLLNGGAPTQPKRHARASSAANTNRTLLVAWRPCGVFSQGAIS